MNNSDQITIYVANLPFSWRQDELKKFFARAGEIRSAKVMVDRFSGKSQGYGFVCFTSAREASYAITEFDGTTFGDRTLTVSLANSPAQRQQAMIDESTFADREDRFMARLR